MTCDKETKAVESFTLPQGLRHNPNHAEQVGGLMLKSLGLSDRRLFFNSLMTIAEDNSKASYLILQLAERHATSIYIYVCVFI